MALIPNKDGDISEIEAKDGFHSAWASPISSSSVKASTSTKSLRVPHQTPTTCTARHPTTTIELAFVLGYTFHAHSCAAQTAYIGIGCSLDLHSKKGVDHAKYA